MKKINYKYKIIVSAIISFIAFSCNEADEFLIVTDPNLPVPNFSDLSDTNQALNGAYSILRRNQYFAPLDFSMLSDESVHPSNRLTDVSNRIDQDGEVDLMRYDLSASNPIVENVWSDIYDGILQANFTINGLEQIDEPTFSEDEREQFNSQMGQARLLRGMGHFLLHSMYRQDANLSIILRDSFQPSISQGSLGLSTSEAVIESFVADLEFARANAPLQSELPNDELGRVTRGLATMLLGNHFLNVGDFEEAAKMYNSVINDFGYRLASPSEMFSDNGQHNSESILEITYGFTAITSTVGSFGDVSTTHRFEDNSAATIGDGTGRFRTTPALWLINEYQNDQIDTQVQSNINVPIVRNGVDTLVTRTLSQRASAMLALVSDEVTPFYLSENLFDHTSGNAGLYNGGNNVRRLAMYKKYASHDIQNSKSDNQNGESRFSTRNVVIMRLAEAHINLAECLIAMGDVQGAINQLNIVRRRWDLVLLGSNITGETDRTYDNILYDEVSLMNHLMFVEKPLELSAEGFATRLIDLRRWENRGLLSVSGRFQQLSQQQFLTGSYVTRTTALPIQRNNAVVIEFPVVIEDTLRSSIPFPSEFLNNDRSEFDINTNNVFTTNEFNGVSNNYQNSDNGFFPIPQSEIINNNSL